MHRHGYKGRKFHRERDQRRALIKGLADSLIIYETIETTLPKAKEVMPYVEKLITKAKKNNLASRRSVISDLHTVAAAHKLVDEIAPKLSGRNSGYLRVVKTSVRRGDLAQLAKIEFVDDISKNDAKIEAVKSKTTDKKPTVKKPIAKKKEVAK